jgi:hypothetical protein
MLDKINYNCNRDLKPYFPSTARMNDDYSTCKISSARYETAAKSPMTNKALAKEP